MEQQTEQTDNRDLHCTICSTALSPRSPASASVCQHVNSIRFAEFFWDEA
jgi:hypothetical protein